MSQVDVNWLAVVVSGVASMIIGFVYYAKPVLGKMWMKEVGKTEKEIKDGASSSMYVMMFVSSLVLAYVMTHFVSYAGAKDAMDGATTGFWVWLGFAATTGFATNLFSGKSMRLFAINYGYHLVDFVVIGAIVAGWMK